MIKFLLKKTFFDLLDNAFKIAALNLVFIALFALTVLASFFSDIDFLRYLCMFIGIALCSIYAGGASLCLKEISNYRSFNFLDIFSNIKKNIVSSIALAIFISLALILVFFVLPYYILLGKLWSLIIAAFLFWMLIFCIITFQFFFPAHSKSKKALKKCILMIADNHLFCLFCFIFSLCLFIISALTLFLFPGVMGILLFLDEAYRLRVLKYSKTTSKTKSKNKVLWDVILADEKEKTGSRTLRNIIFPWKN